MKYLLLTLAHSFILLLFTCNSANKTQVEMPLVYQQHFNDGEALAEFEYTDPDSWKYHVSGALECTGQGNYEPAVRSPYSYALISGKQFGTFVMEATLQQTGRIYDHQDMVLVFGFQNPKQFYYTHISKKMDDRANQIMIVNNADRRKISTKTNEGQKWINGQMHKIRLKRNINNGSIELFFDDMDTPVMEASDTTFGKGMIGFGSFDDSGIIDNIRIWSDDSVKTSISHFAKK